METHQCLNCSNTFSGNYCNNCGEKVYTKHDKSLGHLLEEVMHFFTHFEGKFFKSLRAMFTSPGLMSYDYCRGLRKKYFKPVSLYILLVVIYLVFPLMQGLNMPLKSYIGQSYYGSMVNTTIQKKQIEKGIGFEELSHLFVKKSDKLSKILLVVILPLCALVLMLLWRRKKEFYFFDHFILSAELNSFFLIFQFFIVPAFLYVAYLISGKVLLNTHEDENFWLPIFLLLLSFYAAASFRRIYGAGMWMALLKGIAFTFLQFFIIFVVYKFLLFVSVMALI